MDYILPGIPPISRHVAIPFIIMMAKLMYENRARTFLLGSSINVSQIGMIHTKRLPITGIEQAKKMLEMLESRNNIETGK